MEAKAAAKHKAKALRVKRTGKGGGTAKLVAREERWAVTDSKEDMNQELTMAEQLPKH